MQQGRRCRPRALVKLKVAVILKFKEFSYLIVVPIHPRLVATHYFELVNVIMKFKSAI